MPGIVPAGSKVLVTGANGFIAAWVVRTLLEKGYAVRGTVRSEEKGEPLKKIFADYKDKFEIVVVEDITKVLRILETARAAYLFKSLSNIRKGPSTKLSKALTLSSILRRRFISRLMIHRVWLHHHRSCSGCTSLKYCPPYSHRTYRTCRERNTQHPQECAQQILYPAYRRDLFHRCHHCHPP